MWHLLFLAAAVWGAFAAVVVVGGRRWQSVKPAAATAPPAVPADSPEEGNR